MYFIDVLTRLKDNQLTYNSAKGFSTLLTSISNCRPMHTDALCENASNIIMSVIKVQAKIKG